MPHLYRSLVLLVAAGVLTACGSAPDGAGTPGSPSAGSPSAGSPSGGATTPATTAPPDVELTVTVDDGAGTTVTRTLTCDPPAGDLADPVTACAQVAAVGTVGFAPPPADEVCTEIFGGPEVATVTGTVDGEPVRATFTRINGCETSRWESLAALLSTAR